MIEFEKENKSFSSCILCNVCSGLGQQYFNDSNLIF